MMEWRYVWGLAVGVMLAVAAHTPARAFEEPDGFGAAKFGMRIAQVREVYPKLRAVPRPAPKPDDPKLALPLTSATLDEQTVGPLTKCQVEFRFFRNELYEIQFACPEKDKIGPYLTSRFGESRPGGWSSLLWKGTVVSVTYAPAAGAFAFGHMKRTQQEAEAAMAYAREFPQTPPAAPPVRAQSAAQPTPANPPAAAALSRHLPVIAYADAQFGAAPLTVHFSLLLAEEIFQLVHPRFSWDFDDDSPRSHKREPTHVFTKPGVYKVRVKVTENDKSGAHEVTIAVDAPQADAAPSPPPPAVSHKAPQKAE
ncbi:MAG: PKD domain-containing protein [Candidatus Binatia bacterium]